MQFRILLSVGLVCFVGKLLGQSVDSVELFWQEALGAQELVSYDSFFMKAIPVDAKAYNLVTEPSDLPYNQFKSSINSDRLNLLKEYEAGNISIDSVSEYFVHTLVDELFPYWYGTPWDFNGYTDTPQEGYIACGYFVSTTLKHMGINWNRYKLAQQAALLELKTVAGNNPLVRLPNKDAKFFVQYIKDNLQEGLYVLGLTSHVGFLYYHEGEIFVMHSNFVFPSEVVLEYGNVSNALLYSWDFYLAPISGNTFFLEKWLKGEKIEVITQ